MARMIVLFHGKNDITSIRKKTPCKPNSTRKWMPSLEQRPANQSSRVLNLYQRKERTNGSLSENRDLLKKVSDKAKCTHYRYKDFTIKVEIGVKREWQIHLFLRTLTNLFKMVIIP